MSKIEQGIQGNFSATQDGDNSPCQDADILRTGQQLGTEGFEDRLSRVERYELQKIFEELGMVIGPERIDLSAREQQQVEARAEARKVEKLVDTIILEDYSISISESELREKLRELEILDPDLIDVGVTYFAKWRRRNWLRTNRG